MTVPDQTHSGPTGLSAHGERRILCTMEDFHNFVVEEKDAVLACWRFEKEKAAEAEMTTAFELLNRRIEGWCRRSGKVQQCWGYPRRDDLLVLMVATDEDVDGALHSAMTDLEMALFDAKTPFRLYFLLLRSREVAGMGAFINPDKAWLIYSAD